jgi:queuosine precursor transporter
MKPAPASRSSMSKKKVASAVIPKSDLELHPIEASELHARRERVFLLLAGIFLGTMVMLNILGISRFIKLFEIPYRLADGQIWNITFAVAIGVLPYPITFLCTDFISEFYGRRRANWVVTIGFLLNLWVVFILWLGGILPGAFEDAEQAAAGQTPFFQIRTLAFGAVGASMIAYLAAQFCDVYVFHFWKRVTKGRWLWLRNNGSTLVSQLIDTVAVILITHYFAVSLTSQSTVPDWIELGVLILSGYTFKAAIALLDTLPFYLGVHFLRSYLQFDSIQGECLFDKLNSETSSSARLIQN